MKGYIKRLLISSIWIIRDYLSFRKELKVKGITNVKIFKLLDWHDGFYYFTAEYDGKIIFIKTDFKIGLLSNEVDVIEILNATEIRFKVPKIIISSLNSKYNFIALEFIQGIDLSTNEGVNYCKVHKEKTEEVFNNIIDSLHNLGVVHRDIKPQNIFIEMKGQQISFFLIDFYFAINTSKSKLVLKEVQEKHKIFLSALGEEFRYGDNIWDDAFSFINMIEYLGLDINVTHIESCINKVKYCYEGGC